MALVVGRSMGQIGIFITCLQLLNKNNVDHKMHHSLQSIVQNKIDN